MRIAILVHNLTGGGAERVAALWANGFDERGHDVFVVTSEDRSQRTYAIREDIKVLSLTTKVKSRLMRGIIRFTKLRKTLKQMRPDVVIEVMPSWLNRMAMTGINSKKISTEHNSFERPNNSDDKINYFKKYWLNKLYDQVTVLTRADKKVIGNRLKNVSVMPNPLVLKPATTVPRKDNVVLAVGRKDSWFSKGFDILLKAWARITIDVKGWKLQIVGDSNSGGQDYLKALICELGVDDSVELPGFQEDIQPYYERASVFVLSSRYEGFGLVLIEAMSQGCACVACDYKGRQSEIVTNGVDGVTCEPDNVEALADAIRLLIVDDERRIQLQTNAILRSADFSIDIIMDRWEEIISSCLIK